MTPCNTLNVKLSNSQLNKTNSGIKTGTEVTLKLLSNVACDSNCETNFPQKLWLTNIHVLRLRTAFENGSSVNIKLSRTQMHKTVQSGRFSGRLVGPLPKLVCL